MQPSAFQSLCYFKGKIASTQLRSQLRSRPKALWIIQNGHLKNFFYLLLTNRNQRNFFSAPNCSTNEEKNKNCSKGDKEKKKKTHTKTKMEQQRTNRQRRTKETKMTGKTRRTMQKKMKQNKFGNHPWQKTATHYGRKNVSLSLS